MPKKLTSEDGSAEIILVPGEKVLREYNNLFLTNYRVLKFIGSRSSYRTNEIPIEKIDSISANGKRYPALFILAAFLLLFSLVAYGFGFAGVGSFFLMASILSFVLAFILKTHQLSIRSASTSISLIGADCDEFLDQVRKLRYK